MLIATWNVNSLKARLPRVEEWAAQVQPDVLCMQETKMADGDFPLLTFQEMGYEAVHHGEGRWNGVAILSRVGIEAVVHGFADGIEPDTDARLVTATCGGVRVITVYVPNGRSLEDDHYQYKLSWLARLRAHLDAVADPATDVVVLGDWNIAPEDRDVYDPKAFEGATHVSDRERKALDEIKGFGLVDVFRQRYEDGGLYSWWDYRGGNFHKKMGLRIDYLLASRSLAGRSVSDLVDRNARKGQKPSDHAPVLGLFTDA